MSAKRLSLVALGGEVDAVNEAVFFGRALPRAERARIAAAVAGRQGLKGAYADMFAPTEDDFRQGVTLFTGEQIRTRAATAHILGEEACRLLLVLNARSNGCAKRQAGRPAAGPEPKRGSPSPFLGDLSLLSLGSR